MTVFDNIICYLGHKKQKKKIVKTILAIISRDILMFDKNFPLTTSETNRDDW